MKYVIVIPDGCADEPLTSLPGRPRLRPRKYPQWIDWRQREKSGLPITHQVICLPEVKSPISVSLGYDPDQYFTGRAPLEAAAQGIEQPPNDWAVRCNLVTIEDQVMKDFTADHITTEEASSICFGPKELYRWQ